MASQGVWYQAMVNGKQVWHFYPAHMPGAYPVEPKDQWELAYPASAKEQPKAIVWKSTKEVPPPTNKNAVILHQKTVVLHAPGSAADQAQALVPTSQDGVGYYSHCTYNYYNTYNYASTIEAADANAAAAAAADAAAKAEEESKAEAEGISITEDEVKMDAMLHEQAQALRQLHYLHTVDYGAGDVYGRRYVRG